MKNLTPNSRLDLGHWLNELGLTGVGVEVGTLQGWFAHDLLSTWCGKRLYVVDAWRYLDNWKDDMNAQVTTQMHRMTDCFKALYKFDRRAVMIRDMEDQAATLFQDASLDFVYLDADHSYEAVKAQISRWWPLIRPSGVLGTHDYLDGKAPNNSASYGVKQAFDEFADGWGLERVVTKEFGNHEPSCFLVKRVIDDRI